MPYTLIVKTVCETEIFIRYANEVWTDLERAEFVVWIEQILSVAMSFLALEAVERCDGAEPAWANAVIFWRS